MPFLLVVAGAILLLAGSGWFPGAGVVGAILIIAGVVMLLIGVVGYYAAKRAVKSVAKRHRSFFE